MLRKYSLKSLELPTLKNNNWAELPICDRPCLTSKCTRELRQLGRPSPFRNEYGSENLVIYTKAANSTSPWINYHRWQLNQNQSSFCSILAVVPNGGSRTS